jgi:hypothetical protein
MASEYVYPMYRVDRFYGPDRQVLADISLSYLESAGQQVPRLDDYCRARSRRSPAAKAGEPRPARQGLRNGLTRQGRQWAWRER